MTAHVTEVMRRAAELERSRRKPLRNLAPVKPIPLKKLPNPAPSRNPLFNGLCPLCGCHTTEVYCHAHRWAA